MRRSRRSCLPTRLGPLPFSMTRHASRWARARATGAASKSGHRATQEAIEAQLGGNAKKVARPFRALRLRRHDAEYPSLDTPDVTSEEAEEALEDAHDIVVAMKKFLANVGPWN